MIIVKMNESTVECSIAASELHEIGLTPEAVVSGAENTTSFLAQINREVGEQLDYDPETEVMMMSKNMMMDGSVRIFAVKLSNDDIQRSADRIRGAAETILNTLTQDKIDEIKAKTGKEKGIALNDALSEVAETISGIYTKDFEDDDEQSGADNSCTYQPISEYAKYMMEFDELDQVKRFSKVVQRLPIVDSALYKHGDRFYLIAGLLTMEESTIYDMRRAGVEYSEMLTVNSPEAMFIEEHAEVIISEDAIVHMADLAK